MNVHRLYPHAVYPAEGSQLQKDTWARSERFMNEDLAKSGLTPGDIQAFPLAMVRAPATAGYVIPYFGVDGGILRDPNRGVFGHMHRIRLFLPPNTPRDVARNFSRYVQPSRREVGEHSTRPYLTQNWRGAKRVALVEGEKKAAALAKRWGYGVIGIGGFANWMHHDPQVAGLHEVILEALSERGGQEILVIPDGDAVRFDIGENYSRLCGYLRTQCGMEPRVINMARMSPNKIDDWLVRHGDARAEVVAGWEEFDFNLVPIDRDAGIRDYNFMPEGEGRLIPNDYNVLTALERHPMWAGAFRMNTDRMELTGGLDTYAEQIVTQKTTARLQSLFHMPRVNRTTVRACIGAVAWQNKFSPLKDWLMGLVWDGVHRLEDWLIQVTGAEDNAYVREVSRKFMVAAVARKMDPGCMVDFMVVLKGAQGIGKSSLWRELFGKENVVEFTREASEGKDRFLVHHRGWCVVDEELGSLSRRDSMSIKAFLTVRRDVFRAPYAANVAEYPRQFVCVGTTNSDSFLPHDPSGYRRFPVVEVQGLVDFEILERIREQLWAEAVMEWRKGVMDYSEIHGVTEVAESFVVANLVKEEVLSYLTVWRNSPAYRDNIDTEGWHCLKIKDVMMGCGEDLRDLRNPWKVSEYKSLLIGLGFEWRVQGKVRGKSFNGHVRIKGL